MKFQTQAAILAAALPAAVIAQTWTACNPLEKTCPCDPALGKSLGSSYYFDFRKGKASDVFENKDGFKITYLSDGAHLPVGKKGDAPTLTANRFIFQGKLEAILKIAPGKGIVSSLVFQSDDLDEIDMEWIGSKGNETQSNYFGKGNTEQYNRGATHPITDASGTFHSYAIEWTKTSIIWYLDNVAVRTLTPDDSTKLYNSANYYPQTPMQIKIGAWAAGDPSNSPGVIEWSDGPIDYKSGPYEMVIQSINLTDYTTSATQYCYKDKLGSWDSIKLSTDPLPENTDDKGDSGDKDATTTSKPATTPTPTSSSKSSTKSKITKTMEVAPAVSLGVPDSIGGFTPGPQNKGVSTETPSGTATGVSSPTSAPSAANTPSSANAVRTAGFGGLVVAAVAAIFAL